MFACGNVLHVHDLVDYVSEEAVQAGRNAAKYLLEGPQPGAEGNPPCTVAGAVRYTVPCTLSPQRMEAETVVRFRVGRNLRDAPGAGYRGRERAAAAQAPGDGPRRDGAGQAEAGSGSPARRKRLW